MLPSFLGHPTTGCRLTASLLSPRGYAVREQLCHIGDRDLRIESLLDDQQFHDPDGEAERLGISSASWPLFGQLWPSACVLAELMAHIDFRQRRVLEVGCGLGLASLVAQGRGADIAASDVHPLVRRFLAGNAARNAMQDIPFFAGDWSARDPALGVFALIIASDVLYDGAHPRLLSAFIDCHAEREVEVVVVDPGRGRHNQFAARMREFGYDHTFTMPLPQQTQAGRFAGKIHTFLRRT